MDFKLPYGPWKQLVSAHWLDKPLSIHANKDGLLLLLLFDEGRGGRPKGVVLMLVKPFLFQGDASKALRSADSVTIKKTASGTLSFALAQAKPHYSKFDEAELAGALKSQYASLVPVSLSNVKSRSFADLLDSERDALLGDPLSFFSILPSSLKEGEQTMKLLQLGESTDGGEVYAPSGTIVVSGSDEKERVGLLRLLLEEALVEGAPCLVIDECGFDSLSFPKQFKGASFNRRAFELGKSLFVELSSVPPSVISSEEGWPNDAAIALASVKIPGSFEALAKAFDSRPGQFESRKAARCARVMQKRFGSLTGRANNELPAFASSPALYYADLTAEDSSLGSYSLLASLPECEGNAIIAFNHSGSFLGGELASLLASLAGKGYRLFLGFDPGVNPAFLEDYSRFDCLAGQCVHSDGAKKTRFTPRKPL